jgi:hypothetical protein
MLEPQGAQRTIGEIRALRAQSAKRERGLLFFRLFLFLDCHVLQFTGLENVSTFLTFHIFGFFVAGDYLYPRMLAQFGADFL